MANTLSKTGITTGNTVRAFHVTQSIDAFSGTDAYDITLSGSLTVSGSVSIKGLANTIQNSVVTINTSTGQLFYTASSAFVEGTSSIDTGSFVTNSQTGSFVTNSQTGSFTTNSQTGSFVTNSQTGSFVTNSQTGSFLISASAISNTIYFTSSNGGNFGVTIDTGSSGGGALTWVSRTDLDGASYTIPASNYGIYNTKDNTSNIDTTLPGSADVGSRIHFIFNPASTTTPKYKIEANSGQTITLFEQGTTSTAGYFRFSGSLERQSVELTCVVANTTWIITNWFPYNNLSGSGGIKIA